MLFLFAAWLVLGLTWTTSKRFERATFDWTKPADRTPGLWGALFGLLNVVTSFAVLVRPGGPDQLTRAALLASIALSAASTLAFALRAPNKRVAALWHAFAVTLLVLSCLLAVLACTPNLA